ncbi:MAG: hypothetical protein EOP50_11045 [Sphingobacteriales bacterium]|nr:MAG: hypothetical protein EOP50_11045 [Sphingobacteriales bacterium]
MTTVQERRFNMMLAVLLLARTYPDVVAQNLTFKKGILKLDALVENIKNAIAGQSLSPEGASAEKKLLRANLTEATVIASGLLSAWAVDRGDVALKARSKWTASTLDKLSEVELEQAARNSSADAKAARLLDPEMGLSEEDVLQLDALIGSFVEKKTQPRSSTTRRSRNTATLSQLMTGANAVLRDQLDKAIVKYKVTAPEFYKEYKENRKVMDVAGRKEKGTE